MPDMKNFRILLLPLCLAGLSSFGHAESLTGRVASIDAGDRLTLMVENRPYRMGLLGIDAPERTQAFGEKSRSNLGRLAFNREARADCGPPDRIGQRSCLVRVQPDDCRDCGLTQDLGLAQVGEGMAWWNRAEAGAQSRDDRGRYENAEFMARLRRLGLWSESKPVPPWQFRKGH